MEVLTTRLRLRPELAGRRSPVGDGGDVEEEGGRGEGGWHQDQDLDSCICAFSGT